MLKHIFKSRLALGGAALAVSAAIGAAFLMPSGAAVAPTDEGSAAAGPPPAPVIVAEAVLTTLAPLAEAPGSVVSVADSLVAAATSGKVIWVAEIGTEVAAGEPIARLDPTDAQGRRDAAAADVARLAGRADYLGRLVERFDSLGVESGESEAAVDEMRANRDEARRAVQQAQIALRLAEADLARTTIAAPFSGRIAARDIDVGEFATPGAAVARLVDTRRLEVVARAPANLVSHVAEGSTVRVSNGGVTVAATVRAVVPVGDETARSLELRLALPEPAPSEQPWPIGAGVAVSLPAAAPKTVVAAARDAIVLRAGRVSVFKVGEDGAARRVDVELGSADGDLIEVVGEVAAGDRLIIRGAERLRDGQPVAVADAPNALS